MSGGRTARAADQPVSDTRRDSASTKANASAHIQPGYGLTAANFHNGRFNYLLADGHVETLRPEQTLGTGNNPGRQTGMWTILAGD